MPSDRSLLLGLDVGTTRTKALLVDQDGHEPAMAAVATPFVRSEQGAEAAEADLRLSLAEVVEALGPDGRRVAAVGIAGMAESGAPVDRHGRALAPVIAWHDTRGAEVVARLDERFGAELHRSIGQRLRTVSSVAKLGWLLDQGVDGVERWLGVPELYLHGLTGNISTEFSLAARTGSYHVGQRRYLPEVAEALGVGADVFPDVNAAGVVMGRITAPGAAWSGLPEGAAVTIAGHDHLVGSLGSGAGRSDLVNSVGTAETVIAADRGLPDIDLALSLTVAVTVMPAGKGWALLASAARSGIVLAAMAEALGRSIPELDDLAMGASAVAGDAVGVGELISRIERQEPVTSPPAPADELWHAVLHLLAARTWAAADRVGQVAGISERMVVCGGGSRSRPWLAAKSRLGPMPVWRSSATEAVARGAALYAGVAAGWWPSAASAPRAALELIEGTGSE